ncbi:tyrosine-type recombinase/integrase [Virgibacillus pantothenticus]|uniref:tyrosine-type recombinase/integrase n=1 Tax=Virgibacillus pantothenticus TaxID=1473 RepID=UPI00098792B7|nr:tyrosine-type recombinase/integrase [Virgibacillus pantothenticus]
MGKNKEDLPILFRTFLSIKTAEGKAKSTLRQYKDNYAYFERFLELRRIPKDFSELNRALFRDYITYMREEIIAFDGHRYKSDKQRKRGLASGTINTRLKTLRVMFRCLYEEEITPSNPIDGVKNIPDPVDNIEVLTIDELRRLLQAPDKTSYAGMRDVSLLYLSIDSMARIGELTQLKSSDFDFDHNTVTIRAGVAKNRKPRTLPLRPATTKLIKRLVLANEEFNTDYVFLTNYGEPIDRDLFRKRLYEYGEKAKIKKKIHPHLLRHSAATSFLEDGGSIRHLQMLLGHSDLRMVLRYTHLSNKAVEGQHTLHSPINKIADKRNRPRKTKL